MTGKGRQKPKWIWCPECKRLKLHKALGMCRTCYRRELYRRRHPPRKLIKKIQLTCPQCYKNFEIYPSWNVLLKKRGQKEIHCSRKCLFESKKIYFDCEICKKSYTIGRGKVRANLKYNQGAFRFCGTKCMLVWQKKRLKEFWKQFQYK